LATRGAAPVTAFDEVQRTLIRRAGQLLRPSKLAPHFFDGRRYEPSRRTAFAWQRQFRTFGRFEDQQARPHHGGFCSS
jgi:hypothetical protein